MATIGKNTLNKKVDPRVDFDYKDVFIIPQYSEITSRKDVDTSVKLGSLILDVPVISANMDTVTDSNLAISMFRNGGIGALHRFQSIDDNVDEYLKVRKSEAECLVSVGVNEESKKRTESLYKAGARYFIIDIAHGHTIMMKNMISWMKNKFSNITVISGNVATSHAIEDLYMWGADIAKVGIGPGAVCLTKNVTGVTRPQFTAVLECSEYSPIPIIADGGMKEIGDICKAIGAGATYVMSGKFFSSCIESPGERINGKKVYRGMASKDAMLKIKQEDDLPTPEGMSTMIDLNGTVENVIRDIKGGLQSSMSYCNSRTIDEFRINAIFGVRL